MITERETIVYADSQNIGRLFWSEYGILVKFQLNVISRVWRQ